MRYRWFDKGREQEDELGLPRSRAFQGAPAEPEDEGEERLFSRGELTAIILTSLLLVYNVAMQDVPMVLLTVSILAFMLRKMAVQMGGEFGHAAGNVLKGFSIALFLGTIVMLFM